MKRDFLSTRKDLCFKTEENTSEPSLDVQINFPVVLNFSACPRFIQAIVSMHNEAPYLIKRRFFSSGSEANHLLQTYFLVWLGFFFCLHQSADPRWLFCNIWYTTRLFLSHLLVTHTCGCWGGICLSQGLDGAKNNVVRLFVGH